MVRHLQGFGRAVGVDVADGSSNAEWSCRMSALCLSATKRAVVRCASKRGGYTMWYVVMSKSVVPRETIQGTEPDNLAWMKTQHEAGKVLFSGPTTEGVGIWILHVGSREEAEALVKTHPWV